MDRFEVMATFVSVARNGSFSRAASELSVSPAVTTKRVQQLEAHLKARLLDRTTRMLRLTSVGRSYYDFCNRILNEVLEQERDITRMQDDASGPVKVLSPMSFGIMQMGKVLAGFMSTYPDIQVTLTVADSSRHVLDPIEFDADVAIRFSLKQSTPHITRKLGTLRWVTCASPQYLKARGAPRHPKDLTRHPCLVTNTRFADGRWDFSGPEGPVSVQVTGPVTPSNAITMRYMVLDGAGVALLPNFAVADDLAQGRLVRVLPDYRVPDLPIAAIYPHRKLQPRKIGLFLDYTASVLKSSPWHSLQ